MFRKASILCHPDKVNEDMKEEAEQIFIELKKAYDSNDSKKVSDIFNSLNNHSYFKSKSETVIENEKLKLAIQKIKIQINNVLENIAEIKENETYIIVSSINNWDDYFKNLKSDLTKELENLKNEKFIIETD